MLACEETESVLDHHPWQSRFPPQNMNKGLIACWHIVSQSYFSRAAKHGVRHRCLHVLERPPPPIRGSRRIFAGRVSTMSTRCLHASADYILLFSGSCSVCDEHCADCSTFLSNGRATSYVICARTITNTGLHRALGDTGL